MKIVCTTAHINGINMLIVDHKIVKQAKTEIEIVRFAKSIGIDFTKLTESPAIGSDRAFYVHWTQAGGRVS